MSEENHNVEIDADRVERVACSKCGNYMDVSGNEPFSDIACPHCGMKQVVPMRLGSFLLIKEMGRGGMGAVYRAFDQTLGRYVAIKVMQRQMAEDKARAESFLREARATAALNHPNVVQIYTCGQIKGQLYIVMELVDGGRLDEMIEGGHALDEVRSLEIAVDVAHGLEAAHEAGLVHGDVKPANILFDKQKRGKVVDFGLARFASKDHQPGEIWGTPYYIAPEKVRSQPEDHRSDIYSLGATMYHVLGARPPFEGKTAKDVVLERLKNPAISLRVIRPSLQPETADVIARMLEADPNMRYPTYKSLLADLNEALRIARQNQGVAPKPEERKSRKPLVIAAVIAVAAIIGAVVYIQTRPVEEPLAPDPVVATTDDTPVEPTPTEEPTRPTTVFAVQPFNAEQDRTIVEAGAKWAKDDYRGMYDQLQVLFNELPRAGVDRPWISLLQALPPWSENRDGETLLSLRGLQDATLRELEGDQLHPGAMPQTLARFMLGRVKLDEVRKEAEKWPAWFADLVLFFEAVDNLRGENVADARKNLDAYASKSFTEPAWPYAFQDVARAWIERIDEWEDLKKEVADATAKKAYDELRKYRAKALPAMIKLVEAEVDRANDRVKLETELAKLTKQKEHEEVVQAELDRIDELRTASLALIVQRDFRRAATNGQRLESELKTDEAKETLKNLVESYNRMEDLKRFLIARIGAQPLRQADMPELGGDTMGANLTGIRISLGGYGSMVRTWDQVTERLFASLAEHYLTDTTMPAKERADMTLSLAVFCYQTRGFRPAAQYAEKAVELDADIKTAVRRLMPDILPE